MLVPLSGDDALPGDRFERLVDYYREHPDVGMTYGDMEVIDVRSEVIAPSLMKAVDEIPLEGQVAGRLLRGNFITAARSPSAAPEAAHGAGPRCGGVG